MSNFFPAAGWALAMLALATGVKLGWFDRGAAITLLMIMPILAYVTIQRISGCCARVQGA